MDSYLKLPEKKLIASYKVTHLLTKRKRAHTDAKAVIAAELAIVLNNKSIMMFLTFAGQSF